MNYNSLLHCEPSSWYGVSSIHDTTEIWNLFNFPLTSVKYVFLLEEQLSTYPMFRREFVRKLSSTDSSLYRHKSKYGFANFVIDSIFDRALLRHFSWTGCKSIQSTENKYAFKSLVYILKCIHEIVSSRLENYTEVVNNNFFRVNILKCSLSRLIKRPSKYV